MKIKYSYSRVSCFESCPYQFKLRYIDELKTVAPQEADNALVIGNAMHKGIETNRHKAVDWYFKQYYCISDSHINETIKLEVLIKKAKKRIPDNAVFEYEIDTDDFHGFVDMMVMNQDGTYNIYDFKYSNNVERYMESGQLHIYKYYLEKHCNIKVKSMGFIFIPKTMIRQKKTEELYHFRKRLVETLANIECQQVKVPFDESKVKKYLNAIAEIESTKIFEKNQNKLCDWCEFKNYCEEGLEYMLLPKNEKRIPEINLTPDMWLYGDSYSGKTVFMDSFENVLMLNTDGNVDHITSPVLRISDVIETEGRITKRKMACGLIAVITASYLINAILGTYILGVAFFVLAFITGKWLMSLLTSLQHLDSIYIGYLVGLVMTAKITMQLYDRLKWLPVLVNMDSWTARITLISIQMKNS